MPKTIEVTATDLTRIKVVLSSLKRGKWELEGEEILAFAQGFGWVAELQGRVKAALDTPDAPAPETPAATEGQPA